MAKYAIVNSNNVVENLVLSDESLEPLLGVMGVPVKLAEQEACEIGWQFDAQSNQRFSVVLT